ncbi:hypothetical protein WN51_11171 [Melipona quadrifasciata]|uniref:Uncharacterized protein n=1 Tax=Melipona quadrifasciata TaxID=166423 RepID=A0A0N0U651_9HYME|nr:hypothetical protein WN51_11171 [Melipona quadrifasciata]
MPDEFHSPPISRASKFARDLSDLEPVRFTRMHDWEIDHDSVAFGNEICQRLKQWDRGIEKWVHRHDFLLESLRIHLFSNLCPQKYFLHHRPTIYLQNSE